ncbi:Hypp5513 [Branchiostoma lanceolatum]|uniref:Hypp5513 protein n=1 Tax=Branchiostoma lanceolatum TaxID=7740 RepID=A0A8J9VEV3_BRALA|nr:Hypp5513 [Branchiostoma lanceolatum]
MEDFKRRYAAEETDQFPADPTDLNRSGPGRYSDRSLKRRSLNQAQSASRLRRSATLGPEQRARRRQTWDGAGSNLAAFLFANDLKGMFTEIIIKAAPKMT